MEVAWIFLVVLTMEFEGCWTTPVRDTIAREIYINDGQIHLKPTVDLDNFVIEDFSSFLKHENRNQEKLDFQNPNLKYPNIENTKDDEVLSDYKTYTQEILFTSDVDATQTKSIESEPTLKKDDSSFDSWSIVWYIASFGGLIVFFLIVSCSEWCCRKQVREQQAQEVARVSTRPNSPVSDVPPPAYELFAPPPYDSCLFSKDGEKHKFDVYVVPVHAIRPITTEPGEMIEGRREAPPSYAAINIRTIAAQTQNTPT